MISTKLFRSRFFWVIALSFVLLPVTFFIVLPVALNSDWLQQQVSKRSGLTITWKEAEFSRHGRLSLRQLTLQQIDGQETFILGLADAGVTLELSALLHRHVRFHDLRADINALRVGGYRFQGAGKLTIDTLQWHNHIDLTGIRLRLDQSSVFLNDELLTRDLSGTTRFDVHGLLSSRKPKDNLVRLLSGELFLTAHADAWDLLNDYLMSGLPWLQIGGHSRLTAQLTMEKGHLQENSYVRLDSPQLHVWLDEAALTRDDGCPSPPARSGQLVRAPGVYQLAGTGAMDLAVTSKPGTGVVTTLQITLREAQMRETSEEQLFLQSPLFTLSSVFPDADLVQPARPLATEIQWHDAVVPDISVLSRYLPASAPVQLDHGRVELNARIDLRDDKLLATLHLDGKETGITLLNQPLEGELSLNLPIELDFKQQRLDLSGSVLHLLTSSDENQLSLQTTQHPTTSLTLENAWLKLTQPYGDLLAATSTPDAGPAEPACPPPRHFPDPLPVDGRIRLSAEMSRLDFFDPFLRQLFDHEGMQIAGQGQVRADLILAQGVLAEGSQAEIVADDLSIRFLDLQVQGQGTVAAQRQRLDDQSLLLLQADFTGASLTQTQAALPLLESAALSLAVRTPLQGMMVETDSTRGTLHWNTARIPDLSVLQHYLPENFPLQLLSGSATSEASFEFDRRKAAGHFSARGQAITTSLFNQVSRGELAMDLRLGTLAFDGSSLDLSGSRFSLDAVAEQGGETLHTSLVFDKAQITNWLDADKKPNPNLQADLVVRGEVGQLGFLDSHIPRQQEISIRGGGTLYADLKLRRQQLAADSRIALRAEHLSVDFLQYRASGAGTLDLLSEGAPAATGARLTVILPLFNMGRKADQIDYVKGEGFSLESSLPELNTSPPEEAIYHTNTQIIIEQAEVPDLRVYNAYLPVDAGIELTGGQALLQAYFALKDDQASGQILLESPEAALRIDELSLEGRLSVKAVLNQGDVRTMRFDASGTQVRIDQVSLRGAHDLYSENWWAELYLYNSHLHWAQPLLLTSDISIYMRDTGLLAQLFIQQARGRQWLGHMLNVPEVAGGAHIALTETTLGLTETMLRAGNYELLADLLFENERLNGELFVRRSPFSIAVTMNDSEPTVRFFGSGE